MTSERAVLSAPFQMSVAQLSIGMHYDAVSGHQVLCMSCSVCYRVLYLLLALVYMIRFVPYIVSQAAHVMACRAVLQRLGDCQAAYVMACRAVAMRLGDRRHTTAAPCYTTQEVHTEKPHGLQQRQARCMP